MRGTAFWVANNSTFDDAHQGGGVETVYERSRADTLSLHLHRYPSPFPMPAHFSSLAFPTFLGPTFLRPTFLVSPTFLRPTMVMCGLFTAYLGGFRRFPAIVRYIYRTFDEFSMISPKYAVFLPLIPADSALSPNVRYIYRGFSPPSYASCGTNTKKDTRVISRIFSGLIFQFPKRL